MSSEQNSSDQDIMRPLRLRYLEELVARQKILDELSAKVQRGTVDQEDRDALIFLAHKLSGTGATYGFPKISETAALLEDLLVADQAVPADLIAFDLDNLMEACAAAHDQEPVAFSAKPLVKREPGPGISGQSVDPTLPLVLVVDDDESARAILCALIFDYARVNTAANAEEALALMKDTPPDLILLDDNMPGEISGMKLLEHIREVDGLRTIPVIMITAADQPESVMRGLTAGAIDYVIKPYDSAIVGKKIRTRLKRSGTRILIVDDDRTICNLLARKFGAAGYITQLASDGLAALEMMRTTAPDLVLLDRMLPGLDGVTVLQMMREIPSLALTPVIFLTARRSETDILDGFALGAADYIVKPFNPDEVVARCTRLLGTAVRAVA